MMIKKNLEDYYTVGNHKHPFFTEELDPAHCFSSIKEAREELDYLRKTWGDMNFVQPPSRVWRVQTSTTSTRLPK